MIRSAFFCENCGARKLWICYPKVCLLRARKGGGGGSVLWTEIAFPVFVDVVDVMPVAGISLC